MIQTLIYFLASIGGICLAAMLAVLIWAFADGRR